MSQPTKSYKASKTLHSPFKYAFSGIESHDICIQLATWLQVCPTDIKDTYWIYFICDKWSNLFYFLTNSYSISFKTKVVY